MQKTTSLLRVCIECGLEAHTHIELDLFAKSIQSKHGRHNMCKKCRNKYNKAFYKSNSSERLERHTKTRQNNKVEALKYKGNKCNNCKLPYNGDNECVFDFHHIDPSKKDICPSKLMTREWKKITLELDKCILLCSNCHRLEHKRIRNES